jgi:hypothetical protein
MTRVFPWDDQSFASKVWPHARHVYANKQAENEIFFFHFGIHLLIVKLVTCAEQNRIIRESSQLSKRGHQAQFVRIHIFVNTCSERPSRWLIKLLRVHALFEDADRKEPCPFVFIRHTVMVVEVEHFGYRHSSVAAAVMCAYPLSGLAASWPVCCVQLSSIFAPPFVTSSVPK